MNLKEKVYKVPTDTTSSTGISYKAKQFKKF